MGLEQIWLFEKLKKRFKMNPCKTSIEVGFLLIVFIFICYIGVGYLPEKGRQLASISKPTKSLEIQTYIEKSQNTTDETSGAVKHTWAILVGIVGIFFAAMVYAWSVWRNKKSGVSANGLPLSVLLNKKINEQTCNFIQKYGVWQHKTTGLYYCPYCAPNPSPMSNDNNKSWYCPKCKSGFGEGDVFTVDDENT